MQKPLNTQHETHKTNVNALSKFEASHYNNPSSVTQSYGDSYFTLGDVGGAKRSVGYAIYNVVRTHDV